MRTYQKVIEKKRRDMKYVENLSHKIKGAVYGVTRLCNQFFHSFQPSFSQYADPQSTFSVLPPRLPPGPRVPPMQIGKSGPFQPPQKPYICKPRGPKPPPQQNNLENEVQFIASNKGNKKTQKQQKVQQKKQCKIIEVQQDTKKVKIQSGRPNKSQIVVEDARFAQMPKAPQNPFFIYLQQKRADFKYNYTDFTSQQSKIWNAMSPQEKQPFIEINLAQRKQYQKKMEQFVSKYPDLAHKVPKKGILRPQQEEQKIEQNNQRIYKKKVFSGEKYDIEYQLPQAEMQKQIETIQILPVKQVPFKRQQRVPKQESEAKKFITNNKPLELIDLDD